MQPLRPRLPRARVTAGRRWTRSPPPEFAAAAAPRDPQTYVIGGARRRCDFSRADLLVRVQQERGGRAGAGDQNQLTP